MFEKIKKFVNKKGYYGLMQSRNLRGIDWKGDFLNAYEISLYVNSALSKRGEKVGQTNFILKDKNGEVIKNDKFIEVINNPCNFLSGNEFWKLYQIIKDIYGKVYLWLETERKTPFEGKELKGIHFLNPKGVKDIYSNNELVGHKYQNGTKEVEYTVDEVIKSYYPKPDNPLQAQSLLVSGSNSIDTDIQLSQYQTNIIKNGGKVESILKFKTGNLTKDQLAKLRDDYSEQYATAKNAGKPLFLGGDAEYINLGLTPNELSYLETRKMSLNDISILTGVPKSIMGNFDDIKYSNAQESLRIFYSETINPLLDNLVGNLTKKLYPKGDFQVGYIDQSPEDKENKRKDIETGNAVNALTTNEKREMLGLDPIKGGDVILVPFNLTEMEESKKETKSKTIKSNHPLSNFDVRRKYWKVKNATEEKMQEEVKKVMSKFFEEQLKRFINDISGAKKGIVDENFNLENENAFLIKSVDELFNKIAETSGQQTLDFFKYGRSFKLDSEMQSWLSQKKRVFAERVNKTTGKKLEKEVAESLIAEESNEELFKRIEETVGEAQKNRLDIIARTEAGSITSHSSLEAYKQVGLETKIWTSVMDKNTRPSHMAMDGEEVPINNTFSNGLQYPRDLRGEASEVVGCRCAI